MTVTIYISTDSLVVICIPTLQIDCGYDRGLMGRYLTIQSTERWIWLKSGFSFAQDSVDEWEDLSLNKIYLLNKNKSRSQNGDCNNFHLEVPSEQLSGAGWGGGTWMGQSLWRWGSRFLKSFIMTNGYVYYVYTYRYTWSREFEEKIYFSNNYTPKTSLVLVIWNIENAKTVILSNQIRF